VTIVEKRFHSARPRTYLVVACAPELEEMTEEHKKILDDLEIEIVECGIMGYNAADTIEDLCRDGKADWIINVGTAGSHVHPIGSVIHCKYFGRRDVDATKIMRHITDPETGELIMPDFPEYVIPGFPANEDMLVGPWQDRFNTLAGHASNASYFDETEFIHEGIYESGPICWTGETANGHEETTEAKEKAGKRPVTEYPKFEVIEMEAWWMAKKCQKHQIPFTKIAVISDGEDPGEWSENAGKIPWGIIVNAIRKAKRAPKNGFFL